MASIILMSQHYYSDETKPTDFQISFRNCCILLCFGPVEVFT